MVPSEYCLPAATVRRIYDVCIELGLDRRVVAHGPTRTAAETQHVLPPNCLVEKTVTGKLGDAFVLWTGVSDYTILKRQQKAVARALGMPTSSSHSLNPPEANPMTCYAMAAGMVSPFLIPNTPAATSLAAICVVPWPEAWNQTHDVAISLSLHESLIIPLSGLNSLLRLYLENAVPAMRLLIDEMA